MPDYSLEDFYREENPEKFRPKAGPRGEVKNEQKPS